MNLLLPKHQKKWATIEAAAVNFISLSIFVRSNWFLEKLAFFVEDPHVTDFVLKI